MRKRFGLLKEETAFAFNVQVTRSEAFSGPDADKWIEADTLERVQLEAQKSLRKVEEGELGPNDEIIPAVVIYTRKRPCAEHPLGRFKARCVALGNRQTQAMAAEIYSPTISHAANRYLLVEAAANGWFIEQFDISNAFMQAVLGDERVFIRLPKNWSADPKGDKVRLLKSLYGLKISPRKWFDTYRAYLEGDGWVMCDREPGLFRKNSMILSVYVDDSMICGPDEAECKTAMKRILEHFTGKVVPPQYEGDVEVRDVLGATVRYDRKKRWLRISMGDAIEKVLKKFNMHDCRAVSTPCERSILKEGAPNETFPIRQLVGSLQYIATTCRCDIVFAVQRVARQMTQCTENVVIAAKRVLKYLKGAKDIGLEYSPAIEADFQEVYSKIAAEEGKSLGNTVCFADADFAGCSVTLRSTSGNILYHRGVPIVWASKRQTVKATSTCESEYMALYDMIKLTQSQGYLDWFLGGDGGKLPLTFTDNKSALDLSKSSVITKRSKHIQLRYHVVRDFVKDLCYCPTGQNRADCLTKPVVGGKKYIHMFKNDLDAEFAHFCSIASVCEEAVLPKRLEMHTANSVWGMSMVEAGGLIPHIEAAHSVVACW